MKKFLLSIALVLAFFVSNEVSAQEVTPEILSVSVAANEGVQGAFISWQLEGEDANATAFRVSQIVDGEAIALEDKDLASGFHYNPESLVTDGPQIYTISLVDADGGIITSSPEHATAFVSIDSDECEDPILISWTPYVGLEISEQKVYVGKMLNDPLAEVFSVDATEDSFSYTPTDLEPGQELFISVASLEGPTQSVSNEVMTVVCGTSGIEDLRAHLAVGPNPATENIAITLTTVTDELLTLSAYSTTGQQVYSAPFSQQANIEVAQWANGLYVYKLTNDEGSVLSGKFLKN